MYIRLVLLAAATAVGLSGAPAFSASYDAHSFIQTKTKKSPHSLKFSKRTRGEIKRFKGGKGKHKRKFLLENSSATVGSFVTNGNTATLTGTIRNKAGQGFDLVMNFDLTKDPGVYKSKRGVAAATGGWSFYKMTSGTLTSLSGELASFDLFQKGSKRKVGKRMALATQFGMGANAKNEDMLGLFSRFKAVEQGCDPLVDKCQKYRGNLKLTLSPNYGPGGGSPTTPSISAVPIPASIMMLPAALGLLGVAGGIARRRRRG